ncbi:hypothetical protein FE256_03880 [Microbacterium sp. 5K110]|jgi:hypothetical protein|nr:hypothetical protein FE256_03880 [Microbacterium sp. 5K110]
MARKVCAHPGCPNLTTGTRCTTHQRERERQRGTRQQRGYGPDHERTRAAWEIEVQTGRIRCANPNCLRPDDPFIHPGEPWDLGHTPDRTGYRGPEHSGCNRSEGGRTAHQQRGTHP